MTIPTMAVQTLEDFPKLELINFIRIIQTNQNNRRIWNDETLEDFLRNFMDLLSS